MKLKNEYINRIKDELADEFSSYEKTLEEDSIKALRVNTLKGRVDKFINNNEWNIKNEDKVPWCSEGFYIEGLEMNDSDKLLPPGKHPYHSAGVYYIQEPSAMAPVEELDVQEGLKILDLCASPGGKTTQIAAKMKGQGILFANEPYPLRAKNLSENVERMGITNCVVISHEPWQIEEKFNEYFDRILVDAPCSGEGMFRKNEEAINEWSLDNVIMCAKRQKEILNSAYKMLSCGGRMVYSTCTFSKDEDENNVNWFLDEYKDMKLVKMDKLWPHKIKGEGHFLAVFEKIGDGENVAKEKNRQDTKKSRKDKEKDAENPKNLVEFMDFSKEFFNKPLENILGYEYKFIKFGDELYVAPKDLPSLDKLKVLRLGLHLGTLKKNRFEPSLSLALALDESDVNNSVSLSYDETLMYLRGETINRESKKGWCLLNYGGYSVGFGKSSSNVIKNHYPKGLRNY